MRKDNEELRNLIRGRFDHDQSNLPTLNNDNYSNKGYQTYQNPLNQTNLIRVNNFKK